MGIVVRTAAAIAALGLCGCVAGQHIKFDYQPAETVATAHGGPISLSVEDNRSYVKSGSKPPSYLGHFRAGMGNTWDVNTEGRIALAEQMRKDLRTELTKLGFGESGGSTSRRLAVEIVDWDFDAYTNGKFWYHLVVTVSDESGKTLAESELQSSKVIEGSVLTGPTSAFERELPKIYDDVIRSIVRDNPDVLKALNT